MRLKLGLQYKTNVFSGSIEFKGSGTKENPFIISRKTMTDKTVYPNH